MSGEVGRPRALCFRTAAALAARHLSPARPAPARGRTRPYAARMTSSLQPACSRLAAGLARVPKIMNPATGWPAWGKSVAQGRARQGAIDSLGGSRKINRVRNAGVNS